MEICGGDGGLVVVVMAITVCLLLLRFHTIQFCWQTMIDINNLVHAKPKLAACNTHLQFVHLCAKTSPRIYTIYEYVMNALRRPDRRPSPTIFYFFSVLFSTETRTNRIIFFFLHMSNAHIVERFRRQSFVRPYFPYLLSHNVYVLVQIYVWTLYLVCSIWMQVGSTRMHPDGAKNIFDLCENVTRTNSKIIR